MIRYNTKRYWGYSTDTKPVNAQIGDRFLEMDTQLEYVFSDYNKWELIGSNASNFTGGTVSGETIFTNGLTANTISATTYLNLPSSGGSFTGGTVSGATIFTGGLTANTISATTYLNLPSSGGSFTGGTVSGATIFTGGLTANTITPTSIIYNDLDYLLLSSFRSTYNY